MHMVAPVSACVSYAPGQQHPCASPIPTLLVMALCTHHCICHAGQATSHTFFAVLQHPIRQHWQPGNPLMPLLASSGRGAHPDPAPPRLHLLLCGMACTAPFGSAFTSLVHPQDPGYPHDTVTLHPPHPAARESSCCSAFQRETGAQRAASQQTRPSAKSP